jgi:NAD(P)H dehydrogenase (quinone)
MIAISGATGKLGRLIIEALIQELSPSQIVALVRNPEKAKDLVTRGTHVRQADYNRPDTLPAALKRIDKLLLISSNEVGQRIRQHGFVIEAAKDAGVKLLAYTSVLHADASLLGIAGEHKETERLLRTSGLPFVVLRNGWYTENYIGNLSAALEKGVIFGCAGDGRIASAAREDYAAAAAAVLIRDDQEDRIYELAGDTAYTMTELAAEITRQANKTVEYRDLSEEGFKAALVSGGMPLEFAAILADSDVGISKGALFDDSCQLSQLIGRPTTPLAKTIAEAINELGSLVSQCLCEDWL